MGWNEPVTGGSYEQTATPVLCAVHTCTAFGSPGSDPGQFFNPKGVAVDREGLIIVADEGNDRIQVCDMQGVCTAFDSPGTGLGQFSRPHGVAVDSQDRLAVADTENHRLLVLYQLRAFGSSGTDPGQFVSPTGVAVDQEDRL